MLDHRGFIAETNATHLFMVFPGEVGDPSGAPAVTLATPTTVACPEGITRSTVLRLAASAGIACAEGEYTLTQLYNAAEAFVTGTMGGLAPVVSVDGRSIGDGAAGPVTKYLTELYVNLAATTGAEVA
jgi:branched-chain amino acid aminotransferase